MADTMTGTFPDRASAERAITNLASAGFAARLLSPVPEATGYDQGSALVGVDAQGRDAEVRQMLQRSGALTIQPAGAQEHEATTPPAEALPLDANGTIGGVTPSAVTDAPPQPEPDRGVDAIDAIGGMAPSSVSSAAPGTASMADVADQRDGDDTQIHRTEGAPADNTIVSPGIETPYTERQAQSGDTSERRPITDEDIIAEARRERDQSADQSADLDVAPDAGEQNASPPANH